MTTKQVFLFEYGLICCSALSPLGNGTLILTFFTLSPTLDVDVEEGAVDNVPREQGVGWGVVKPLCLALIIIGVIWCVI